MHQHIENDEQYVTTAIWMANFEAAIRAANECTTMPKWIQEAHAASLQSVVDEMKTEIKRYEDAKKI